MKRVLLLAVLLLCMPLAYAVTAADFPHLSAEKWDGTYEYWEPVVAKECKNDPVCIGLVMGHILVESHGDPHAVSITGAKGILQHTSGSAYGKCDKPSKYSKSKYFAMENRCNCGKKADCAKKGFTEPRFDPFQSITAGTATIMSNYKRNNNNVLLTYVAYNSGPGIAKYARGFIGDKPWTDENVNAAFEKAMHKHYVVNRIPFWEAKPPSAKRDETIKTLQGIYRRQAGKIGVIDGTLTTSRKVEKVFIQKSGVSPQVYAEASANIDSELENHQNPFHEEYQKPTLPTPSSSAPTQPQTPSSTAPTHDTYYSHVYTPQSGAHIYDLERSEPGTYGGRTYLGTSARVGTYTVRPGTKAKVQYNFNEYDELEVQVQSLQERCSGAPDISVCIARETAQFNTKSKLQWNVGSCEMGPSAISMDIAAQMDTCLQSEDENCLCDITVSKNYGFGEGEATALLLAQDEEIIDSNGMTLIGHNGDTLLYSYHLLKELVTTGTTELTSVEMTPYLAGGLITKFDITTTGESAQGTRPALPSDTDYTVRFKKKGNDLIFDTNEFSTITTADQDAKHCTLKKKTYRFCVASEKYSHYAFSDVDNQIKERPVTYKFALHFEDGPLPLVQQISTYSVGGRQNTIALEWESSPSKNVQSYMVIAAQSQEELRAAIQNPDAAPETVIFDEVPAKITAKYLLDSSIDFLREPVCNYNTETGLCSYEYLYQGKADSTSLVLFQPYITNDNARYVYLLPGVENNQEYFLAIIALNQQSEMVTDTDELLIADAVALDKLAPGPVDFSVQKVDKAWVMSITPPELNMDGSQNPEAVSYGIYFSSAPFTDRTLVQSFERTTETTISTLGKLPPGTYHFAVTAIDEAGNEATQVKSQEILIV